MLFLGGLGGLIYISVLLVNAIAILSQDRFLARIGWGSNQPEPGFGGMADTTSVKAKTVHLISSVQTVMKYPLIAINVVIILYELALG